MVALCTCDTCPKVSLMFAIFPTLKLPNASNECNKAVFANVNSVTVFLACPTMVTGEHARRNCVNSSQGTYGAVAYPGNFSGGWGFTRNFLGEGGFNKFS
jgi:hypothetical protein